MYIYTYIRNGLRPIPPPCLGCGQSPHGCFLGSLRRALGGLWGAVLRPLGGLLGLPGGKWAGFLGRPGGLSGRRARNVGLCSPSGAPPEAFLGLSWAVNEASWAVLGPSWAVWRPFWRPLEPSWVLGRSWGPLGPGASWASGSCLGPSGGDLEHLGAMFRRLGAILDRLGGLFGPSWPVFGPYWAGKSHATKRWEPQEPRDTPREI